MKLSETESLTKLWSKDYCLLLAANLLVYLGFYMLVPTLPTYTQEIGGSTLQASLVISVFSVSALIFRFVTGNAVDAFGKKLICLAGIIIMALSTLSYLWVSVTGIILIRLVQGIGWGMFSTSLATAIADIVPLRRRGEGMGYYSLTFIVSMSLAPMAAIIIMNQFKFTDVIGISTLLFVLGAGLLYQIAMPQVKGSKPAVKKQGIDWRNFYERQALLPSMLCFLISITLCGVMSYLMLFGKELNMTSIWIYFVGNVVMSLITRPLMGRLFDERGHVFVILPGVISAAAGLIVLSYTDSIATLVAASVLYGFGFSAVQPSLQTWAVNRSPAQRKGAANGTFLSSMDLSFTFGSVVLSFIAERQSYAVMYRVSSLFAVLCLVIYVYSLVRVRVGQAAVVSEAGLGE